MSRNINSLIQPGCSGSSPLVAASQKIGEVPVAKSSPTGASSNTLHMSTSAEFNTELIQHHQPQANNLYPRRLQKRYPPIYTHQPSYQSLSDPRFQPMNLSLTTRTAADKFEAKYHSVAMERQHSGKDVEAMSVAPENQQNLKLRAELLSDWQMVSLLCFDTIYHAQRLRTVAKQGSRQKESKITWFKEMYSNIMFKDRKKVYGTLDYRFNEEPEFFEKRLSISFDSREDLLLSTDDIDKAYQDLFDWLASHKKYKSMGLYADEFNSSGGKMQDKEELSSHKFRYLRDKCIKAVRLSPNNPDPDVQRALGLLFYSAKYYNEAVDCWKSALSVEPDDVELWFNLALTLFFSKNWEEVIITSKRVLQLIPLDCDFFDLFLRSLRRMGMRHEAFKQLFIYERDRLRSTKADWDETELMFEAAANFGPRGLEMEWTIDAEELKCATEDYLKSHNL